MYTLKIPCKVITPMFMEGAIKNSFEFRPASVIGVLRYWMRAILCDKSQQDAFTEIAKYFGKGGENNIAANLRLEVENDDNSSRDFIRKNYFRNNITVVYGENNKPLRTYEGGSYNQRLQYGLSYLFFTKNLGINKNCEYADPGFEFNIVLSSDEIDMLKFGFRALCAASIFGGLGSRTRRGAGCFAIEYSKLLNPIGLPAEMQEVHAWIRTHDKTVDTKPSVYLSRMVKKIWYDDDNCAQMPTFFKEMQMFFHKDRANQPEINSNYKIVLESVGRKFADYRLSIKRNLPKAISYGFPYRDYKSKYKKIERHASPLVITVFKFKDSIITLLYSINEQSLPREFKFNKQHVNDFYSDNNEIINMLNNNFGKYFEK